MKKLSKMLGWDKIINVLQEFRNYTIATNEYILLINHLINMILQWQLNLFWNLSHDRTPEKGLAAEKSYEPWYA